MTHAPIRLLRRSRPRADYREPVRLDPSDGRPAWVIEALYTREHGHGFTLSGPVPGCEACQREESV